MQACSMAATLVQVNKNHGLAGIVATMYERIGPLATQCPRGSWRAGVVYHSGKFLLKAGAALSNAVAQPRRCSLMHPPSPLFLGAADHVTHIRFGQDCEEHSAHRTQVGCHRFQWSVLSRSWIHLFSTCRLFQTVGKLMCSHGLMTTLQKMFLE